MASIQEQWEMVVGAVRQELPLILDYIEEPNPAGVHCEKLYEYETAAPHLERQAALKRAVRRHLEMCFEPREIEAGCIDWESGWVVNIFDHHVPLNYPFLIGTNVLAGLRQIGRDEPNGIVVLSDSGVPLNNLMFNRGFMFKGHRIPLFTNKNRHRVVFGTAKVEEFPDIELPEAPMESRLFSEAARRVHGLVKSAADYPGLRSFADQVSRINYHLWPELFAGPLRDRVPALFYAAHEEVANSMLLEWLADPTQLFTRILCEASLRREVLKTFDGITGCWVLAAGHGTDFFWGIDAHGAAARLTLEGEALVNRECGIRVKLEPDALCEAIVSRSIYPGMFLVYGMSHFHCGVRSLGGVASVNYLTAMKAAWIRLFETIGEPHEADLVRHVDTRGCIGGPIIAWQKHQSVTAPMFALDVLARGGFDEAFFERLRIKPFGSLMKPALLTIFSEFLKDDRRNSLEITPEDIAGADALEILD